MELNSKKLERKSKIIYYTISIVLCIFLVLLSNRIIYDLDKTIKRPHVVQYEDEQALTELNHRIASARTAQESLQAKKEALEKTIRTAQHNYNTEKQSFDDWVETRRTLMSPDQDTAVINRVRKLDELRAVMLDWQAAHDSLSAAENQSELEIQALNEQVDEEREQAWGKHGKAMKRYELHVFLIRLLFTAPILALGIFFFIRYRNHRFWPLYLGFTLFSAYVFFFGLVPYLPSYGGYVRYTGGILLSLALGYYAINHIRQYIERKKAEVQISAQERAKKIQSETAEKALENHFCPSCGKDFILKQWEFPANAATPTAAYRLVTNFCRHCGLELFKTCKNCDHKNFAHLPYCASCGVGLGTA